MAAPIAPPLPTDSVAVIPGGTPAADKVIAPGSRRVYSDVQNETANYLTNTPNYRAYCKFIEGTELKEYSLATRRVDVPADAAVAERIRGRSRALGTPRADVEARIARLWAKPDEGGGYSMDGNG